MFILMPSCNVFPSWQSDNSKFQCPSKNLLKFIWMWQIWQHIVDLCILIFCWFGFLPSQLFCSFRWQSCEDRWLHLKLQDPTNKTRHETGIIWTPQIKVFDYKLYVCWCDGRSDVFFSFYRNGLFCRCLFRSSSSFDLLVKQYQLCLCTIYMVFTESVFYLWSYI